MCLHYAATRVQCVTLQCINPSLRHLIVSNYSVQFVEAISKCSAQAFRQLHFMRD